MRIHRRFSVFGSRLLFFALAPWLLVCIPLFPYMAYNFSRGAGTTILAAMVSLLCTLGLLVAVDSWRFIRLNIGFLILVPITYVWYYCQTYFVDGMRFSPSFRLSESSPFGAFLGFFVWGVPSILGAFSLLKKARRIRAVEARWRLHKSQNP